MAGFMPAIHVFHSRKDKTWMAGTSPAMTGEEPSIVVRSAVFRLGARRE
jgi:hypothetical protein